MLLAEISAIDILSFNYFEGTIKDVFMFFFY